MYTHEAPKPVGCVTPAGYQTCTNCAFIDEPLGCDGFCAEEHAQKYYEGEEA